MAVFSLKYKYIFFANPQTASKAISRTFQRELEGKLLHRRLDDDKKVAVGKLHHLYYQLVVDHDLIPKRKLDKLMRITGVRNPYDLMVSRYLKHRDRFTQEADRYTWIQRKDKTGIQKSVAHALEKSFPEWLHAQYGTKKMMHGAEKYLDHADMIIRFEAIQEDFDAILQRLNIDRPIEVLRENVTTQRSDGSNEGRAKLHYGDFYDDASRALVSRIFEPTIERFGYKFSG